MTGLFDYVALGWDYNVDALLIDVQDKAHYCNVLSSIVLWLQLLCIVLHWSIMKLIDFSIVKLFHFSIVKLFYFSIIKLMHFSLLKLVTLEAFLNGFLFCAASCEIFIFYCCLLYLWSVIL